MVPSGTRCWEIQIRGVVFALTVLLFSFLSFLGPCAWHMKVPGSGLIGAVAASLRQSYSNASCVCDLHHSSWQCQILNTLSGARDQTCILMDTGRVCNPLGHKGNSAIAVLNRVGREGLLGSSLWSRAGGREQAIWGTAFERGKQQERTFEK